MVEQAGRPPRVALIVGTRRHLARERFQTGHVGIALEHARPVRLVGVALIAESLLEQSHGAPVRHLRQRHRRHRALVDPARGQVHAPGDAHLHAAGERHVEYVRLEALGLREGLVAAGMIGLPVMAQLGLDDADVGFGPRLRAGEAEAVAESLLRGAAAQRATDLAEEAQVHLTAHMRRQRMVGHRNGTDRRVLQVIGDGIAGFDAHLAQDAGPDDRELVRVGHGASTGNAAGRTPAAFRRLARRRPGRHHGVF